MEFKYKQHFQEAAPKVLDLTIDMSGYHDLAWVSKYFIGENHYKSLNVRLKVSSTIFGGKLLDHFRTALELLRHARVKGAVEVLLRIDDVLMSISSTRFNSQHGDLARLLASIEKEMSSGKGDKTHLSNQITKSIANVLADLRL